MSFQVSEKYKCHEKRALPPHIFAVADRAYQSMLGRLATGPKNQCIVIRWAFLYPEPVFLNHIWMYSMSKPFFWCNPIWFSLLPWHVESGLLGHSSIDKLEQDIQRKILCTVCSWFMVDHFWWYCRLWCIRWELCMWWCFLFFDDFSRLYGSDMVASCTRVCN